MWNSRELLWPASWLKTICIFLFSFCIVIVYNDRGEICRSISFHLLEMTKMLKEENQRIHHSCLTTSPFAFVFYFPKKKNIICWLQCARWRCVCVCVCFSELWAVSGTWDFPCYKFSLHFVLHLRVAVCFVNCTPVIRALRTHTHTHTVFRERVDNWHRKLR